LDHSLALISLTHNTHNTHTNTYDIMPYNTNAIPPRQIPTGENTLPLSKVRKIISQDEDVEKCSTNAAFIITVATEMFIQHMAREAHNNAKVERKPRKNIQYQDLANAVAHHDNLQFLEDTIPRAVPYKKIKASAAAKRAQLTGAKTGPGDQEAGASAHGPKSQGSQAKLFINGDTPFSLRDNGTAPPAHYSEDVEMEED
jgi:DNA polymerase epsilon subunit 4